MRIFLRSSGFYFYPRPPRGGRQDGKPLGYWVKDISIHALREEGDCSFMLYLGYPCPFLSTPSARRATLLDTISNNSRQNFYPRPPRGGRLYLILLAITPGKISIHALREEGDTPIVDVRAIKPEFLSTPSARRATCPVTLHPMYQTDFYPRPPRGGRRSAFIGDGKQLVFLSTPSARRATVSPGSTSSQ